MNLESFASSDVASVRNAEEVEGNETSSHFDHVLLVKKFNSADDGSPTAMKRYLQLVDKYFIQPIIRDS